MIACTVYLIIQNDAPERQSNAFLCCGSEWCAWWLRCAHSRILERMENGLIRNLINEIIRNEYLAGILGGKSTLNPAHDAKSGKNNNEFGESERKWTARSVTNNSRML